MARSPESFPGGQASISLTNRLALAVGLAPEGVLISLPIVAVGLVLIVSGLRIVGVVVLAIGAALGAFFRDPERRTSAPPDSIVSAADGRVCDIAISSPPGANDDMAYTRISVFMSPLDVHVNRAPVCGLVTAVKHFKGEFRAAFRDTASEHNERNLIKIKDRNSRDHVLVQVAGYLARRIVCHLRPNQRLERGQRIGLIMFGSRVDHFLPRDYRVVVQVGDRVWAGETVIGEPL